MIVILADDMALGDFSFRNGGISQTPNLDRMARESVWFKQAYSASCVCAPARAAMLTGRYPHRTGVVTLNMNRYPKLTRLKHEEITLAEMLKPQGYTTGLIGKWHCGTGEEFGPLHHGFDEFEGFSGSQDLSYFRYSLTVNRQIAEVTDTYLTDDLSQRAIEFVRRHRDEPFFLHLAHYAPHRPLEAPAERVAFYQQRGLDKSTATIYAMIEIMDRGIGQLLEELDRLKLSEQTIVIFASDNGPDPITGTRFNGVLRGTKYEIYEGGIHVPLIVQWKGHFRPRKIDNVVHFVDLVPTVLELCNIEAESPSNLDGDSFAPLLVGQHRESPVRYWQWNRGRPNYTHNAAVRDGDWKFVLPFVTRKTNPMDSDRPPALYHLANDPAETNDLAQKHPERIARMKELLKQWSRSVETDRLRE
ncbi:sulfatase-like hydrolase/transferase [Thalassoroseus pseudoceratinae]|uniref:sulfatase-like hydrolase/transferase n=1 Tax=Thalassoroseus pseudoceratinae TaxID=2713176 RepID=UPI00197FE265|nr:sulfatase-like hydrolase/transferase [Thalassoroseus pseudoceratinae]